MSLPREVALPLLDAEEAAMHFDMASEDDQLRVLDVKMIVEQLNVTCAQATDALHDAGGDVVEAMVKLMDGEGGLKAREAWLGDLRVREMTRQVARAFASQAVTPKPSEPTSLKWRILWVDTILNVLMQSEEGYLQDGRAFIEEVVFESILRFLKVWCVHSEVLPYFATTSVRDEASFAAGCISEAFFARGNPIQSDGYRKLAVASFFIIHQKASKRSFDSEFEESKYLLNLMNIREEPPQEPVEETTALPSTPSQEDFEFGAFETSIFHLEDTVFCSKINELVFQSNLIIDKWLSCEIGDDSPMSRVDAWASTILRYIVDNMKEASRLETERLIISVVSDILYTRSNSHLKRDEEGEDLKFQHLFLLSRSFIAAFNEVERKKIDFEIGNISAFYQLSIHCRTPILRKLRDLERAHGIHRAYPKKPRFTKSTAPCWLKDRVRDPDVARNLFIDQVEDLSERNIINSHEYNQLYLSGMVMSQPVHYHEED